MSDFIPWNAPYAGWAVVLAYGLLGLWLTRSGLRRRRPPPGICGNCGYDTHASPSGLCPECGGRATAGGPRQWTLVAAGVLVAGLLPALVVQYRVRDYGWDYYTYVGPLYYVWPDRRVAALRHDGYEVCVSTGRRPTDNDVALSVYRDGRRVLRHDDPRVSAYAFGVFDGTLPEGPVMDLDGDGEPELLVQSTAGGNGGDYPTCVVRLPADGRASVRTLPAGPVVTGAGRSADGRWLLTGRESFDCRQCKPQARPVVMRYADGRTRVLPEETRAANAPTPAADAARADALADYRRRSAAAGQDEPLLLDLLDGELLALVFAGRSDEAYRYLDAAWAGPADKKAAYVRAFQDKLRQSAAKDALVTLGHPPL